MHKRILTGALMAALVWPAIGSANNIKCWGDDTRDDISCTALTEKFLLTMRAVTREEVVKAMDAPGRPMGVAGLHYYSNYSRGSRGGSGFVNFGFENGRVGNVQAEVDHANSEGTSIKFMCNASGFFCSDFPGSRMRCNER
jgi:hypothetical protein